MNNTTLSRNPVRRLSTPVRLGVAAVAACFLVAPVLSNPVNPTVVNGTATFNQAGNVLTVTNSNGAIINWDKFSIKAGETTRFEQSSASSSVLNRVLNDPSAIYGTLSSNGRVWLINPAGIMVGASGRIDTAGFVASTLNIRNEDFLAGRNLFNNDGTGKDVINQGEIRTPGGGSVYLIGSNVANEGLISTPNGETILAAGATVSLIDSATPGIKVDITGATGNATNLGEITAEAGRIGIAGVIVRNSGTLNASSVVNDGGRIFLKASQDAYVDGNGRIVTTGAKGGSVEVLGNRVAVMDHAAIDASGTTGGGTIKVGGDYQGKNPDIQNANITWFGPDATLKADATEVGDGGTVIVWADDTTRAYGSISARGGALGGNGGFVETSGHKGLEVTGIKVDTRAPRGQTGTWLLDPVSLTLIAGSGTDTGTTVYGDNIATNLGSTNIVVQTDGSSTSGIAFTAGNYEFSPGNSAPNSLKFLAYGGNISLPAGTNVNMAYGGLSMVAGWDGVNPASPGVTAGTGDISLVGSTVSVAGGMTLLAGQGITLIDSTVSAGGTMDISAQSMTLNAATGTARLMSQGNQTITLGAGSNGILQMTSAIGEAKISTYGSQTINFAGTANTLSLQGSNSNTAYGGNGARIEASGTQNIYNSSGSLAITLTGGSGTATYGGSSYNGAVLVCSTCGTFNSATIQSGGGQTISASNITLQGGSGGNGNYASIETKSSSATQSITTTGLLSITGGTGAGYYNAGINESVTSDAGIHSDGTQTVNAGSITLAGGGDGTTLGGAFLSGKTGQSITTTGNLSMTGGTSTAAGQYGLGAPAIIGEEFGTAITLNIGGNLIMTGGAGSTSHALIGAAQGAPVINITAATGVSMTSGGSSSKIGVLTGGPAGSLTMTATTGNISQDAASAINTATLVALANAGSINLAGLNMVNTVSSLYANNSLNFTNAKTVHIGSATSALGSVSLNTTGAGSDLYLGTATAGPSSVASVNSYGAIYDDNGGVVNISGADIYLTSAYGGAAGGLAISMDVNHTGGTGSITSSVTGGSSGGISIRNSGTPLEGINLQSNASAGNTISFYSSTDLNLGGFSTFTGVGSDMLIASGGNLDFSSASLTSSGSILFAAGGNLTFTGALNKPGNTLGLAAGGAVNVNAGVAGLDVVLAAGSLNVGSSGGVFASNSLVGVVTGDANITGGYIKTTTGDLELLVGGDLNIGNASYGGYIHAGYNQSVAYFPDASIAVGGDLKLNNGAYIKAANDVYLDLMGSTSTLVLNDGTVGYAPSYVMSDIGTGVVGTTHLAFLGRSTGGVMINGIETTTTVVGGSGFFAVNSSTPATAGAGLQITYSATNQDLCAISPDLCKPPGTTDTPIDEPPPTFEITGPGGTQPGGTPGQTAGGSEGSFGGDENGGDDKKDDEKDKKDKKSDQAKDEKKDDKPGQKKVAQCS